MQTIKRNWLLRQVADGKMEAKCDLHLTDDYRFDDANNFGKSDWAPARLSVPKFESRMMPAGFERDVCVDDDRTEGQVNLRDYHFTGKCGRAYWESDKLISLRVHSNLHYTLRFKETA